MEGVRASAREVERLFEDIFDFISSRIETREAMRKGLSRGLKERFRGEGAVSVTDMEEILRVRFTQAFPRAAVMHAREVLDDVRAAFTAWRELSASISSMLREIGASWDTVVEALGLFLRGPRALMELEIMDPRAYENYMAVASVASNFKLNIYTIPMCLRAIFPFVDPENAADYLREARKAFAIIALAHLKDMHDRDTWDDFTLRRLAFLDKIVAGLAEHGRL